MWKQKQLRCSFCGKKESEISKLVAGPRVYICDECVVLAQRIMDGDFNDGARASKTESSVWRRLLALARRFVRRGVAKREQIGAVAR